VHPQRSVLPTSPELLVEQRPLSRPSYVLQSYRWIIDSRDEATGGSTTGGPVPPLLPYHHELRQGLPQGLNPAQAIAEIKKPLVERRLEGIPEITVRPLYPFPQAGRPAPDTVEWGGLGTTVHGST
jgi:hypothetical protein